VSIYTLSKKKKTITSQRAGPSDLLLRMLSNSKNHGQQPAGDVLLNGDMRALDARRKEWNKGSYVIHSLVT
jgi:hypothetical protein